jgi:hypothetical protein
MPRREGKSRSLARRVTTSRNPVENRLKQVTSNKVGLALMKIKICIEPGCKNASTAKDFCRLHYLKNWKGIKEVEQKKAADKLNKYVEGIVKKFPDRYVDVIRREIRTDRGDLQRAVDEPAEEAESYETFVISGDEGLDRLISKIKLDKEF